MTLSSRFRLPTELLAIGFLAVGSMIFPGPAGAVPFDGDPKILLHVRATAAKNACTVGALPDCRSANTEAILSTATGPFYFVYLLGARGSMPSLAALQLGIQYQDGCPSNRMDGVGLDIIGWQLCASLEFASQDWPNPGTGNLITFDSVTRCQTGETAVAGYFYVGCYGTPDLLQVTPRPVDNLAKLVDCSSIETVVPAASLGRVAFSAGAAVPGCNPCDGPCDRQGPSTCGPAADGTPPNTITDLLVTDPTGSSLTMRWTSPADNPGGSGVARYDIRRSTVPITPANFGSAGIVPPPAPISPGSPQSWTILGLDSQTTYYVAMVTWDHSGNRSALSNVTSGTTEVPADGNGDARILLHVGPGTPLPGGVCSRGQLTDCDSVNTAGRLLPTHHYAYLLAAEFQDLAGLQCGIGYDDGAASGLNDHDRLDIYSWTLCATLEFQFPTPAWPSPGWGTLITWDAPSRCQTGAVAVAGYFYVGAYSPDELRVIPRPVDQAAKVANCASQERTLGTHALGWVRFSASGLEAGYNPCGPQSPIAIQPATWSRVKTLTGTP